MMTAMIGTRRRMYGGKAKEAYLCQRSICTLDTGVTDAENIEWEIKVIFFANQTHKVLYSQSNKVEFGLDRQMKWKDYTFQINEPYIVKHYITGSGNSAYDHYTINDTDVGWGYSHSNSFDGTIKLSYHIYN